MSTLDEEPKDARTILDFVDPVTRHMMIASLKCEHVFNDDDICPACMHTREAAEFIVHHLIHHATARA